MSHCNRATCPGLPTHVILLALMVLVQVSSLGSNLVRYQHYIENCYDVGSGFT